MHALLKDSWSMIHNNAKSDKWLIILFCQFWPAVPNYESHLISVNTRGSNTAKEKGSWDFHDMCARKNENKCSGFGKLVTTTVWSSIHFGSRRNVWGGRTELLVTGLKRGLQMTLNHQYYVHGVDQWCSLLSEDAEKSRIIHFTNTGHPCHVNAELGLVR